LDLEHLHHLIFSDLWSPGKFVFNYQSNNEDDTCLERRLDEEKIGRQLLERSDNEDEDSVPVPPQTNLTVDQQV